jgi:hypothetical protein
MTAIWLWHASAWSGVCGDAEAARRNAAAKLRSGDASEAVVEEARLAIGAELSPCYERTGNRWRAAAGDSVRWHAEAA